MERCLAFVGKVLLAAACLLLEATTCMLLWNWFLAPAVGVEIGILQAFGLGLLAQAFGVTKGSRSKGFVSDVSYSIAKMAAILVVGFVVRLFL